MYNLGDLIFGLVINLWRVFAFFILIGPLVGMVALSRIHRWGRGRTVGMAAAGVAFGYLLSLPVIFDFSSSAQSAKGEEYHNERPVAFGPEPYFPFCIGGNLDIPGGWDFYGNEPIWPLYRPVCYVWRQVKGYEAPSNWR